AGVTAGLMWAPEILPSRRMTNATVAPNANPMMRRASRGEMSWAIETAATVPGPIRTSRYVPRSSDRHRFCGLALGREDNTGLSLPLARVLTLLRMRIVDRR